MEQCSTTSMAAPDDDRRVARSVSLSITIDAPLGNLCVMQPLLSCIVSHSGMRHMVTPPFSSAALRMRGAMGELTL